jgi:microcystin-dependent protein
MTSTLRITSANTARTKPTTGDTKMSFVNVDHLGWLMCDGRPMDKTADNLLFQVIGYTFGGSGNTFNLPNPAGRVMGTVGTVTDDNNRSRTYVASTNNGKVGELDHKLVQSEMPSHNHDIAGAQFVDTPVTADGNTSLNATGITVNNNFTGVTDSGHDQPNISAVNSSQFKGLGALASANVGSDTNSSIDIATGNANIVDPSHAHTITDPTHRHQINSNGGDQYHNNIQPTLFYGNTFIYCGVPMRGEFPFKTGIAPVLI